MQIPPLKSSAPREAEPVAKTGVQSETTQASKAAAKRVVPIMATVVVAMGAGLLAGTWYADKQSPPAQTLPTQIPATQIPATQTPPTQTPPTQTPIATQNTQNTQAVTGAFSETLGASPLQQQSVPDRTDPVSANNSEQPPLKQSPIAQAEAAYALGDYEQVLSLLSPVAATGDPLALYRLGYMYAEGVGVKKDRALAIDYLAKAQSRGAVAARDLLITQYQAVVQETDSSNGHADTYAALAALGDGDAQAVYGSYLLGGSYVAKNLEQAHQLLSSAAEQGDFRAMSNLGYMYATGTGVDKNDISAYEWYLQSAKLGFAPAQTALALHLERGVGVEANKAEAIRWYLNAASAGNPNALAKVGGFIADGSIQPPTPSEGVTSVALAAKRGDEDAMQWLKAAADSGVVSAQSSLAFLLLDSDDVIGSNDTGMAYLQQAAEANDAAAQLELARRYASGDGVDQSVVQAYQWANIAAMHGDDAAKSTRDALVQLLTPDELTAAQQQSSDWYRAYTQQSEEAAQ